MMEKDKEYFIKARISRRLRQEDVARSLGTTRSTIANFETGRIDLPRHEVARKLDKLIASWRAEDETNGVVHEDRALYFADARCPKCGRLIPGPDQDVGYCIACGAELGYKRCGYCGNVTKDMRGQYCTHCGKPFLKEGRLDDG